MDRLARGGNAGGLGDPEDRAAAHEPSESAGEAGGDAGAGPQAHREADDAVQADAIDQQSGERRAGGIGQAEGAADQAVLRVRQVRTPDQHGRQSGEGGAVQDS